MPQHLLPRLKDPRVFTKPLSKTLGYLRTLFLAPHCHLCRTVLHHDEVNHQICDACWQDQTPILNCCQCCAHPLELDGICSDCLILPKPYKKTVAAFLYQSPTDFLIKQFKQHQQLAIGKKLSHFLVKQVEKAYKYDTLPEHLTPTPLHWQKQLKRGFKPT